VHSSADKKEVRENGLLAALSSEEFDRLWPNLEEVVLPLGEILHNFNDVVTHLYFPNQNAIVSVLSTTDEQVNVEVGLIGSEGAVGLTGFLGRDRSPFQHLVQGSGTATRLPLEFAREEFQRNGNRLQRLLLRYTHALLVQIAQTGLCNRVHSDEQRLARWLLLSQDRIGRNQLPLPGELLAKMLGRSHSGVSIIAAILQTAGLIKYNGAELVIVDRDGLEAVSCSCYWVVRRHYQDLYAPTGQVSVLHTDAPAGRFGAAPR